MIHAMIQFIAMDIPSVRLVFDRYKVASKTKKGLVQIEVLFKGRRKWISSGVKVYADEWDDRKHVVRAPDMVEQNAFLYEQVSGMEKYLRDNLPFTWEKLDIYLRSNREPDNFIDFVRKDIKERNDIRPSTKRAHRKLASILESYGKIVFMSDLTRTNILAFDNWLHGRKVRKLDNNGIEHWEPMRQQTIHDYHKQLKTYITRAINRGLLKDNPYQGLSFKRGMSEPGRYLTEKEMEALENAPMRSGEVARARDIFVFQCNTAMSYVDLLDFDFKKAVDIGDDTFLYTGQRKKNGKPFFFVLLPKAMGVLRKYDYQLPLTSMEACNRNLKKVAKDAGIDKPLSTHWARRTAAMIFANNGIRMDVVAKILGHASVRTTEKFYASMTPETVVDEMKKLIKKQEEHG